MKTVYLMRHGKSKRGPEYETDSERPLAKRGKRDAARIGQFLAEGDMLPDLVISSPAERAKDTTLRLVEAADLQSETRFDQDLYFGGDDVYLELIWGLDETLASVMFVGHNPVTETVVELLGGQYVRMPTAAVACIQFAVDTWQDVQEGNGRLAWVQLPRALR